MANYRFMNFALKMTLFSQNQVIAWPMGSAALQTPPPHRLVEVFAANHFQHNSDGQALYL